MNITSTSLQYGQLGLQHSQDKLSQATQSVAQASTSNINDINNTTAKEAVEKTAATQNALYGSQIQDGLLDAKISHLEVQANAQVIGAADSNLGTLIDINT